MNTRRALRVRAGKEEGAMKTKVVERLEELLESVAVAEKGLVTKAMKIGDAVRVKRCDSMPEVVGESAEIVDLQIQEFEEYTVYPVWVKVTSGERKGKICGFKYDEVEVLPKTYPTETLRVRVVEQLEEMLKATKVGGAVKIRKCDSMPEVAGESGEIVEMQIQDFERYTAYPVWVKMTSGERKGKIYGFQYDEIAVMLKACRKKTTKTKIDEQLEEILSSVTTMES